MNISCKRRCQGFDELTDSNSDCALCLESLEEDVKVNKDRDADGAEKPLHKLLLRGVTSHRLIRRQPSVRHGGPPSARPTTTQTQQELCVHTLKAQAAGETELLWHDTNKAADPGLLSSPTKSSTLQTFQTKQGRIN